MVNILPAAPLGTTDQMSPDRAAVPLVVELDSERFHGSKAARERDRKRDNLLMVAGWRVIRFTWEDLTQRPDEVITQILAALATAA